MMNEHKNTNHSNSKCLDRSLTLTELFINPYSTMICPIIDAGRDCQTFLIILFVYNKIRFKLLSRKTPVYVWWSEDQFQITSGLF